MSSKGISLIAGVDEVGRGPLAGPVVTAAVILPDNFDLPGLTDSKKLSAAKREALLPLIKQHAICWALGQASIEEIDELNILHATMLAMQRAVLSLSQTPHEVLIDGNRCPELDMPSRAIIGGDGKVACISAASVVAKVYRDQLMQQYAEQYPHYGWHTNSGYPTKQHLLALQEHGVTPLHRRSFAPVAKLL
jgi:ribonuclease HII